MLEVELCTNKQDWDNEVLARGGHPLQLWGWGEVKSRGNWRAERFFILKDKQRIGMAQVLLRPLPWPFRGLAYIPRGPVMEEEDREGMLQALSKHAKGKYRSVSIIIEPDREAIPKLTGWKKSPNPILLARTLILDLTQTEDELLAHMAKKTRQYIRKSEKEGVTVRIGETAADVEACLAIYKETAKRAGFALHKDSYYMDIFETMAGNSQLFMAEYEGRVVAFLWLVASKNTAFELYGGMNDQGQQHKANYTLKWTAIRRMKEQGISRYDMNGLLNDGVSQFKQGFADHETQLAGSYEKPLSLWYFMWARGLPAMKKIVRLIKK